MRRFGRNSKIFIMVVCVGVLILLVLSFNSRITDLRQLELEVDDVSARVTVLEQTQMVLETQIAFATSDAAVEAWAYEEAKMVREGDHLIAPLSDRESTPMPQQILVSTPEIMKNWQVWRALFFDRTLP